MLVTINTNVITTRSDGSSQENGTYLNAGGDAWNAAIKNK